MVSVPDPPLPGHSEKKSRDVMYGSALGDQHEFRKTATHRND